MDTRTAPTATTTTKKRFHSLKPWAVSLALHGAFAGLALWLTHAPRPRTASHLLPVEVLIARQPSPGTKLPSKRGRGGSKVPLKDLGVLSGLSLPLKRQDSGAVAQKRGSSPSGEVFGAAEAQGLVEEGLAHPFFERLWKRVDAKLAYPPALVEQREQGRVRVWTAVDRRGVWTGAPLELEGGSSLLRAYVSTVVLHALTDLTTLSPSDRATPEGGVPLWVGLEFAFDVSPNENRVQRPEVTHFKNLLAFRREAWVEPWLNEQVHRILARYVPPVIPIPGGFFIDFIQVYRLVRGWSEPDPRDLQRERLLVSKEAWETAVKKYIRSR